MGFSSPGSGERLVLFSNSAKYLHAPIGYWQTMKAA
jgi:hypothetical protein